jgi:hypothetical protein
MLLQLRIAAHSIYALVEKTRQRRVINSEKKDIDGLLITIIAYSIFILTMLIAYYTTEITHNA